MPAAVDPDLQITSVRSQRQLAHQPGPLEREANVSVLDASCRESSGWSIPPFGKPEPIACWREPLRASRFEVIDRVNEDFLQPKPALRQLAGPARVASSVVKHP